MKKKKIAYVAIPMVAVLMVLWMRGSFGKEETEAIVAEVKRGPFEINVFTSGELEAKNSVRINGPEGLRSVGIWQVKIQHMIDEGSRVQKGEYIASLDKTELSNKIKDVQNELQKAESQFAQTRLDTTLTLRQARDELVNLEYTLKEKEITLEQSQYEPPATIRQAELDRERSKRAYDQAKTNYRIKESQARAKMQEVNASLSLAQHNLERLTELLSNFSIIAPEDGMLIYHREWNGKKRTVGSTVGAWDPIVATLPDLSTMISKTYVNEVDIRKVKQGQKVSLTLDAFPEKKLTGTVLTVANVGEQMPKSEAKVFELTIQVTEKDSILRPAMTTGNNILVDKLKDVLYIPLEAVHNDEKATFVYVQDGFSVEKRQIKTGVQNENFVVVTAGLKEGEKVFLSVPEESKDLPLVALAREQKKAATAR